MARRQKKLMAELVGGAALGAAFQLFTDQIIGATLRTTHFNARLTRLTQSFHAIRSVIEDVDRFNAILDRPKQETEAITRRLKRGRKLIQKCSRVRWNIVKRFWYSWKLMKLEESLVWFFQIEAAAYTYRECKSISTAVSDLGEKSRSISTALSDLGDSSRRISSALSDLGDNSKRISAAVSDLGERVDELMKRIELSEMERVEPEVVEAPQTPKKIVEERSMCEKCRTSSFSASDK